MRVNGKVDVDVEITTKELVSALKSEVYARLNFPDPKEGRVYVKGERWVNEKTAYTTHSFELEEDLGLAIEEDVEVFDAFHTIAALLKD